MRFSDLNLDGKAVDLVVEDGTIKEIVPAEGGRPCRPVVPAFYNCHTHAAMNILRGYADRYENEDFLKGDPSWFMHQVEGPLNQEAMAFVAAGLSYGRRDLFMAKIALLMEASGGDMDGWVRGRRFAESLKGGDKSNFYRLYTCDDMNRFLSIYASVLEEYGSLGEYVRADAGSGCCEDAIAAICKVFLSHGGCAVIPCDTRSACKRLSMFLRWMGRKDSPVDLGLWSDFIDRRTLLIPLDTHVLQMASSLGLLDSRTASMSAARKLSARLAEVFPDDPAKGDFALFGAGVAGGA